MTLGISVIPLLESETSIQIAVVKLGSLSLVRIRRDFMIQQDRKEATRLATTYYRECESQAAVQQLIGPLQAACKRDEAEVKRLHLEWRDAQRRRGHTSDSKDRAVFRADAAEAKRAWKRASKKRRSSDLELSRIADNLKQSTSTLVAGKSSVGHL